MEIKLNKNLQKKLDSFLDSKVNKLNDFQSILKIEKFSFSNEEINDVEQFYKQDNSLQEYMNIYIGEAVIKLMGGFWSIGKFKNDEAYELPIILGRGGREDSPRICPNIWIKRIDTGRLRLPLGDFIYSL
jgi:hypothetical protein